MERKNVVTFKGSPLTLVGEDVKIGSKAPDFKAVDADLKESGLGDLKGKIKLFASVPSLDTPVCDLEIKRFNEEAIKLSQDIVLVFVSMDLPFALKRFCQANDIKAVKTWSDHREASFGTNYGALIKELRLLTRAIFIVDRAGTVVYVEYVKDITMQPDYGKALEALKKIV